jgi:hypothetical protein
MRMLLKLGTTVAAVALALTVAPAANATNIGAEGCSPGYWKNHTENWEEFAPTTLVRFMFMQNGVSVFDSALPPEVAAYRKTTAVDALNGGGGPGLDGATQILLRASVAAYLNAAHEGLGYPLRRKQMYGMIRTALESGDRATMLALAAELDALNNLGCPLN